MIDNFSLKNKILATIAWAGLFIIALWFIQGDALPQLLVAIGGLIILFLVFSRPELGFAFTFASLPMYTLTILPLGLNFTSVTGLLGGITLVAYLWRNRGEKRFSLLGDRALYGLILLLLIEIFIWDLFVPVRLDRYFIFTYLQLFILVWLAGQLLRSQAQVESFMKIFIAANLIALVFSLQNFDFFTSEVSLDNRLAGLVGNANEFSIYIGVSILCVNYFYEKVQRTPQKFFLIALGLFLFIPILLSGSRGGFLFLVLSLIYQFWRFQRHWSILAGIMAIYFVASTFVSNEYVQRVLNIPEDIFMGSDTVGLRFELWFYALELWRASPLFGIGTGMYIIRSIDSPVLAGRKMLQAHNLYVTHLVENGVIGLVLFLAIFGRAIFLYEKSIRFFQSHTPQLAKLAITWQSILFLFAMNGMKGNLNTNKMLWLTFGISMVFAHLMKIEKESIISRNRQDA